MAPKGQGKGGRGKGHGVSGGGRSMGGGRGMSQAGECVCPGCGEKAPHSCGNPCIDNELPKMR